MGPLGRAGKGGGAGSGCAEGGERGGVEEGRDDYVAVFEERGAERRHAVRNMPVLR